MDYSKLSDFEINKRVFESKTSLAALSYPHSADKRSCGHKDINDIYQWFDFCNNPADAWPIITSNRIGIVPGTATDKWAAHHGNWDIAIADVKPLRAAMIVFLMMQEAK
ncbi:phage protein NinX family protein [Klebsiella aerogenes]